MSWELSFALLAKYYGFSPDVIGAMTLGQVMMYIEQINGVENLFNPKKRQASSKKTKLPEYTFTDVELIKRTLTKHGIKVPHG